MEQSVQFKIISLFNTFFQEFLDYKFKEKYGDDWFGNELLPFLRSYVDKGKADGDTSYDKYRAFLKKNYGDCRLKDMDVTFACAILLYEERYDFQFNEEILDCLNKIRDDRNKYQHATGFDDFEWLSLHIKSMVHLQHAVSKIGRNAFHAGFWEEILSVKASISGDSKFAGSEIDEKNTVKSVCEQEYERAEGFYTEQDYKEAYKIHYELALSGFLRSAFSLGRFYQFGYGVEQNIDTAIEWFNKAKSQDAANEADPALRLMELKKTMEEAEQGDAISELKLGMAYEDGKDAAYDIEKALEWYEKSMQQGVSVARNRLVELLKIDHPSSWHLLGTYYETGFIFPKDTGKAVELYKKVLDVPENINIKQRAWDNLAHLADENDAEAEFQMARYFEAGVVVNQDYSKALMWYEKAAELGHEKARGCIDNVRLKAAENGDAKAQFSLGRTYAEGNAKLKNYEKASLWYKKAAEQGHAGALYSLAVMYDEGLGVRKDHDEALRLFKEAAGCGEPQAQYEMAKRYENGDGIEKDLKEAFNLYRMAALQGNVDAKAILGRMYEQGTGTKQDYAEAVSWYKKAAEQGNKYALDMLFIMYEKGRVIEPNFEETLKWYLGAAEAGNEEARYKLGCMYEDGSGVPRDYAKSAKWYKMAAESGHADAQFKLGQFIEKGRVVTQDYKKAESWYRKAADNGCEKARSYMEVISMKSSVQDGKYELANELGMMCEKGQGVEQDYEEAVKWYKKAAEHDYLDGYYNTGRMYEKGLGVQQDYIESERWYVWAAKNGHAKAKSSVDAVSIKAAELGEPYAMNNLGTMYEEGRIVPQDHARACEWYLKSAELKNNDAQFNMGRMIENGLGVNKNLTEAAKWYLKSAENGHVEAQFNTGRIYENGLGAEQDYSQAIKWYEKAAEQGSQKAKDYLFSIYRKAAENENVKAKNALGRMYFEGDRVKQDYAEAVRWYLDSSSVEDPADQYNIGMMYEKGLGVHRDLEKAAKWYSDAAERGHMKARYEIGRMYENGLGLEQDYIKAVQFYYRARKGCAKAKHNLQAVFEKLSKPGHENIQYALGELHENGLIGVLDYDEAYRWYRTAAENGHSKAQHFIGNHLLDRFYKEKNPELCKEALKWLEKAAEQGILESQYQVGFIYYAGISAEMSRTTDHNFEKRLDLVFKQNDIFLLRNGSRSNSLGMLVKADYGKAMKWLETAADRGHADAMYYLASIYELEGCHRDAYKVAAQLYEKAAERGCEKAGEHLAAIWKEAAKRGYTEYEYKYAVMCENGQGVEKDLAEAYKFYIRAAEGDNTDAQYRLGTMYEHGIHIMQNSKEALKWYKRAAKLGHEASRDACKRLRKGFFPF